MRCIFLVSSHKARDIGVLSKKRLGCVHDPPMYLPSAAAMATIDAGAALGVLVLMESRALRTWMPICDDSQRFVESRLPRIL